MPRGDGTGPMGMGPMTGRAAGICAGYEAPGYMNPGFARGAGFGMGCGFRGRGGGRGMFGGAGTGWRNMFYATGLTGWQRSAAIPTREQQVEALKGQAEYLAETLGDVRKRLEELEAGKTGK